MIAIDTWFIKDVSPWGISDHQSAGNAAKIDAIQRQWHADGVLWLARLSMVIDLVFIAVYSWGGWLGGKMMGVSNSSAARHLAILIMASAVLFGVTDYAETICQFVQVMQFKGSDRLAAIAAAARPVKFLAWIVTFVCLLVALLLRRMTKAPA
jgi:hypothetical protein